jgi:transcription antitermination factor NusG
MIRQKGYEGLVPVQKRKARWSDREKIIETVFFTGYVFCRLGSAVSAPIITTPGVMRIVGSKSGPWPIDEGEMLAIQKLANSNLPTERHPYAPVGSRVLVREGPLAGVEGIVVGERNHRLVLSISLVQRSVSVELANSPFTVIACASRNRGMDGPAAVAKPLFHGDIKTPSVPGGNDATVNF